MVGARSLDAVAYHVRLARGQLPAKWLEARRLPYSRGCLRLLAAAVEGGECGRCGGGSQAWARIPPRTNCCGRGCSRILRAVVVGAGARWLAGSVADARCVRWQIKLLACLGIPAAKGDGRCDVILPNVACYCEERRAMESSAGDAWPAACTRACGV